MSSQSASFAQRAAGERRPAGLFAQRAAGERRPAGLFAQRAAGERRPEGRLLALLALCGAIALALYAPALRGPFVSDDFGYLVGDGYTERLSPANLAAIVDPRGPASFYTGNYAPVHLLLTALERRAFGGDSAGYHAVNVALHALNSWLLALLLASAGASRAVALCGALFFLVHPANVEAVAWASQLKSTAALAFALGAWLCLERRPALATGLFALALGTKAQALFLLPTAALWLWLRGAPRGTARWLWVWLALAAAFAPAQLVAFRHLGAVEPPLDAGLLDADPLDANAGARLRGVFALALRYLVMAASSLGVSAFHEPPRAAGWLDPWWLGGLASCSALAARALRALRAKRLEGVFWVSALAAFLPVAQLAAPLSFLSPLADRYLYFMLPGLVGALCCAATARDGGPRMATATARRAAALALCGLLACFAARSAERAQLWRGEVWLLRDAAAHYPDGGAASFLRARSAAQQRDVPLALAELRRAAERGFDRADVLAWDPGLAPIRSEPAFRAFLDELAARSIERLERRGAKTQADLRALASAWFWRGERQRGVAALEAALAAGGPWDAEIRAKLEAVLSDLRSTPPRCARPAAAC